MYSDDTIAVSSNDLLLEGRQLLDNQATVSRILGFVKGY